MVGNNGDVGERRCAICSGASCAQRCAGCREVWYCGEECQKKHWREGGHRDRCAGRRRRPPLSNKERQGQGARAAEVLATAATTSTTTPVVTRAATTTITTPDLGASCTTPSPDGDDEALLLGSKSSFASCPAAPPRRGYAGWVDGVTVADTTEPNSEKQSARVSSSSALTQQVVFADRFDQGSGATPASVAMATAGGKQAQAAAAGKQATEDEKVAVAPPAPRAPEVDTVAIAPPPPHATEVDRVAVARPAPPSPISAEDRETLDLLTALRDAYSPEDVQARILALESTEEAAGDMHLAQLARVTEPLQRPIFKRFGYPTGIPGVLRLKASVRDAVVKRKCGPVARLARQCTRLLRLTPVGEGHEKEGPSARVRQQVETLAKAQALEHAKGILNRSGGVEGFLRQMEVEKEDLNFVSEARAQEDPTLRDAMLLRGLAEMQEKRLRNTLLRQVTNRPEDLGVDPATQQGTWATKVVEERLVREIVEKGYATIDGILDPSLLAAAEAEMRSLHSGSDQGLMLSGDPCNGGAKATFLRFASVEEKAHLRVVLPALMELSLRLCQVPFELARKDETKLLSGLRVPMAVMVSAYEAGIRYRRHLDSYGGSDNHRMITVLLYLNTGPLWEAEDSPLGGKLRVYPPLKDGRPAEEDGVVEPVELAPKAGRMVILLSRTVYHEVLPATCDERYAMTLWVNAPVSEEEANAGARLVRR